MQDAPSTSDGLVPVADYEKVSAGRERYRKLYLETLERCKPLDVQRQPGTVELQHLRRRPPPIREQVQRTRQRILA